MKRLVCYMIALVFLITTVPVPVVTAKEKVKVYDATVLPENYQTVKGWTVCPGSGTPSMNYNSMTAAHSALYNDLGITMARVPVSGTFGDADGNILPNSNIDYLVNYVKLGLEHGVDKYMITSWMAPESMMTTDPATKNRILRPDKYEAFSQLTKKTFDYLVSKGCPPPVAFSLQNEPASQVAHCDAANYPAIIKVLKKTLDSAGYKDVLLLAAEDCGINQMMMKVGIMGSNFETVDNDPEFAEAIDAWCYHSYSSGTKDVTPAMVESFVKNTKRYPDKDIWQTEYSPFRIVGNETYHALWTMKVLSGDMAWLGANLWGFWWGYDPRFQIDDLASQETLVFGDGGTNVVKSKLFLALSKIFKNVPVGSKVRRMSSNDPSILNQQYNSICDMVAFSTGSTTVAMLINDSKEEKIFNFHGLDGKSASVYSIAESFEGMEEIAAKDIKEGTIEEIHIPAGSVNIVVTSTKDISPPNIQFDQDAGISVENGTYISRENKVKISGTVDGPCEIKINGNKVKVTDDLRFSEEVNLQTGVKTMVRIDAKDDKNNVLPPILRKYECRPNYVAVALEDEEDKTNKPEYIIKGLVNVASTIKFKNDGVKSKEDQTFALPVKLAEGENKIVLTAADAKGNVSEPKTVNIFLDSTQPEITVFNTKNTTYDFEYMVAGKTNEQLKSLSINGEEVKLYDDLSFTSKILLKEGDNSIKIEAVDLLENKNEKELKLNYTKTALTPHATNGVSYTRAALDGLSIDGNLDEKDWLMDNKAGKPISGNIYNNIVNFGTLWDSSNLYVGVRVYDHKLLFDAKEIYNNDTVELFFNPSNKKEGKYVQGDKQVFFGFNKGKVGAYLNTGFDCKYAWKDLEDGYSVEIAIPWDTLGLKPAEGLKIGFDLQNDDQDMPGIRQSIIEWSGTGDNWRDTGKFGTLILTSKKDVPYEEMTVNDNSPAADNIENNSKIKVLFNGKEVKYDDVQPVILNGYTMVPIRATAETLGVQVKWDENTQEVQLQNDDYKVTIGANNTQALVNGQTLALQSPPQIINDRVLVPLRFISEAFGAKVDWDEKTQTITIQK